MLGLVVVTHGRLAEELVKAVKTIVGEMDALEAVSIGWDMDVDEASTRIESGIRSVNRGRGVVVLTDMFGGTPTNLALSVHEQDKIEIVTGVNLPMLVKFTTLREQQLNLHEAADRIAQQGREAIHVATQLLKTTEAEGDGPSG